jgi:class 3 adenylate cyclase
VARADWRPVPDSNRRPLADHREILRATVREHGGEEVDRQGDSFLFAFQRAEDACPGEG